MKRFLLAVILIGGAALSQTLIPQPSQLNQAVQTLPGAMPTSLTCIVGRASSCLFVLRSTDTDPYLCNADFTATGQTITMQDANGIIGLLSGAPLPVSGSTPTSWAFMANNDASCRIFPGGVYIVAGSSGVTGKMTIKFNR